MKLALFDVDGTLIQRTGVHSMPPIIMEYYNVDVSNIEFYFEGTTAYGILKGYLERVGISNPEADPLFKKTLRGAGRLCEKIYADVDIKAISGVREVLEDLQKQDVGIGLLTGNSQGMSKAKLERPDLWKYFSFGAYGDVTDVRSELVPIGIKRAQKLYGRSFSNDDVYIIGDTRKDVQAAKESGAKSIAVATGYETLEQLATTKPDYLFKDFSEKERFLDIFK